VKSEALFTHHGKREDGDALRHGGGRPYLGDFDGSDMRYLGGFAGSLEFGSWLGDFDGVYNLVSFGISLKMASSMRTALLLGLAGTATALGLRSGSSFGRDVLGLNVTASYCNSDMSSLNSYAYKNSKGKNPDGMCYSVRPILDACCCVFLKYHAKNVKDHANFELLIFFYHDLPASQHVADYIDAVGYGGIDKNGFNEAIPPAYYTYAYQFAEYLNTGSNAADLCLLNIQKDLSNNPYNAPTGAIVVVRAGTPGTANPVAGDVSFRTGVF